MKKNELIQALKAFETTYEDEKAMVKDTIDFLNKHEVFLGKANPAGHITGSAWIINETKDAALMTHHFKLDMWVQLGGHTEVDESVLESAYREGLEESGLEAMALKSSSIFDVDVHRIPEKGSAPAHYHYDIRYLFEASEDDQVIVSDESHDVRWIKLDDMTDYTKAWSVLRMVEKTRGMSWTL